jgi:membrane protease subunit (stomatin/prohibitin family)
MEIEIIKYEPRDSDAHQIIAYKHPIEDFSNKAQLLVAPSQVALFVNEGEVIPFLPGHYTLEDSNNSMFGFLRKLKTKLSNGVSSYHCLIYFINLVALEEMPFGTQTPFEMNDPVENVQIHVRFAGTFSAHINNDDKDGKDVIKFFTKVVGTAQTFTKAELATFIKSRIIKHGTTLLGQLMAMQGVSILNVAPFYEVLSANLQDRMTPYFADFGIKIEDFSFVTINSPEEDLRIVREAKLAARKTDLESEAMARKRAREGYTYQQEEGFETMRAFAQNEASMGQFMGMGMGLGMGFGMGPQMGNAVGNVMNNTLGSMNNPNPQQPNMNPNPAAFGQPAQNPQAAAFGQPAPQAAPAPAPAAGAKFCPNCGNPVPAGAKFCSNCGNKMGNSCPACNAEVDPNAKFCPNCGNKLM